MTEYPTAERTATTPLHVSTTPHLAYLLVLLALLAADIATTVWFTRLGLPELNPLLAPIAGSVAAQVAYKAPFALLLIAGTALLAASCDRLQPGAGRYPWLAVAGIYAVPVAWNLVVIAGHTGFHVIPAVVYAPVAVVCAVGVWRAARPRPEALTMPANHPNPRPAGPPSTAPPIASPRPGDASMTGNRHRSTPRPAVAGLILMLLLVTLIPAVSAEQISGWVNLTPTGADLQQHIDANTGTPSIPTGIYSASFDEYINGLWLNYPDSDRPIQMTLRCPAELQKPYYDTPLYMTYGGGLWSNGVQYGNVEVSLSRGDLYTGTVSGPGSNGAANVDIIMYIDWIREPRVGNYFYQIGVDTASYYEGRNPRNYYTFYPEGGYSMASFGDAVPVIPGRTYGGTKIYGVPYISGPSKIFFQPTQFYNSYTIDVDDYEVKISKNGYGVHSSRVEAYDADNNVIMTTPNTSADVTYTVPVNCRVEIIPEDSVYPSYTVYNGITQSPIPDSATVTVYVRNAQSGALLANAHLTILDGHAGSTPAVDQDLPAGTGTFNLEKADTLRYHASATADGYTLLSPILFGVGGDGATIVLWMAPDAPPDVPTEPEKSMLYGYIQTQGSQQPISGATVSLDGYGSTTTSSTGFYLFNNVTPGGPYTLSASASLHDPLSEPVTVDATATQHNLALTGHFLLTVTIKDGDTLANLQNTTISLSDGQESTQNPATFVVDYGPYTITAAAGGYYPQTQSAYLDKPGTTTATVLLTAKPEPVPPPEMPNYPPHNVRFLCIDEYNRPLQNVTLRAVYQESTNPVDWFTSWLGLSPSVNINSTTLEGTTGLDGSVIFLMVESVQYRMTVTAPAPLNMTKTFDLYPKEDEITIRFVTSDRPDLSTMPTYDLTATETDPSSVQLALSYHDTTNATTSLTFNVYDHATGDLIHTQTFDASKFPGTVSPSYDVSNTNGAMYRFGFTAQNSAHGEISQYKGITLKGDNLLVDLGFEDRTLYQWLAVLLLFLFAGAFSGTNVKQGAILVPLFGGGLFWFIGWLPITLGATISAIGFLGVLVYMRKSEWKVRA